VSKQIEDARSEKQKENRSGFQNPTIRKEKNRPRVSDFPHIKSIDPGEVGKEMIA